jgi:hypothetical protein
METRTRLAKKNGTPVMQPNQKGQKNKQGRKKKNQERRNQHINKAFHGKGSGGSCFGVEGKGGNIPIPNHFGEEVLEGEKPRGIVTWNPSLIAKLKDLIDFMDTCHFRGGQQHSIHHIVGENPFEALDRSKVPNTRYSSPCFSPKTDGPKNTDPKGGVGAKVPDQDLRRTPIPDHEHISIVKPFSTEESQKSPETHSFQAENAKDQKECRQRLEGEPLEEQKRGKNSQSQGEKKDLG